MYPYPVEALDSRHLSGFEARLMTVMMIQTHGFTVTNETGGFYSWYQKQFCFVGAPSKERKYIVRGRVVVVQTIFDSSRSWRR